MIPDLAEDITVFLSTTKHTKAADRGLDVEAMRRFVHPICVAEQYVTISRKQFRLIERGLQKSIFSLARGVYIDPDERTVFVGKDPEKESTGLVIYKDLLQGEASDGFFDCWRLYKSMFFEFQVLRRLSGVEKPTFQFSIVGHWEDNAWAALILKKSPSFTMLPLNEIQDPFVGGSGL